MDYQDKFQYILKWAKEVPNFSTRFIESVLEWYDEHNNFTSAQERAIDNIINKWNVPLEDIHFGSPDLSTEKGINNWVSHLMDHGGYDD
jgi:hypothetical protein